MPKRHSHLIERIADMGNLREAYAKATRGKRQTRGYLEFKEYAQANLHTMHERMLGGAWVQGAGHARHADTCKLFNHLEGRYGVRLHQQPR